MTRTSSAANLTLADFLLARIAEDEAAVEFARPFRASVGHGAWGLDRVLAESAATRAIVDLHVGLHECTGSGEGGWMGRADDADPCPTVRHLAAVYADHPDYRDEWRP